MPRVMLTLAERKESERKKLFHRQENDLRAQLNTAKKEKHLTYDDIARISGVGRCTVQKVLSFGDGLGTVALQNIRKICSALEITLILSVE